MAMMKAYFKMKKVFFSFLGHAESFISQNLEYCRKSSTAKMKGNQMEADICRFVEKNLSGLAE